jgi:hypothetical protein
VRPALPTGADPAVLVELAIGSRDAVVDAFLATPGTVPRDLFVRLPGPVEVFVTLTGETEEAAVIDLALFVLSPRTCSGPGRVHVGAWTRRGDSRQARVCVCVCACTAPQVVTVYPPSGPATASSPVWISGASFGVDAVCHCAAASSLSLSLSLSHTHRRADGGARRRTWPTWWWQGCRAGTPRCGRTGSCCRACWCRPFPMRPLWACPCPAPLP